MSNAIIGVPIDSGILTESEGVAGTDQNPLSKMAGEAWISEGGAAPYLVYDLGAATSVISAGVLFVNADATTTIRIRTATSEANLTNGSANFDSTAIGFYHDATFSDFDRVHHLQFPDVTCQWVRVDFTHTGTLRVGRLFVSEKLQPSVNIQTGFGVANKEETIEAKSQSTVFRGVGLVAREVSFAYWIESADLRLIRSVVKERGFSGEVLLIIDPALSVDFMESVIYGNIAAFSYQQIFDKSATNTRWNASLTIKETERP